MIFAGVYERSIDSKQRLAFPAELRSRMQRSGGANPPSPSPLGTGADGMYVSLGEQRRLCLYTVEGFERRVAELEASDMDIEELLGYEEFLLSMSFMVEFDGTGRLRLPDALLEVSSIGREPGEVVLVGNHDHLLIYTAAEWQDRRAAMLKKLDENPGLLMNPRRAMRRRHKPLTQGETMKSNLPASEP